MSSAPQAQVPKIYLRLASETVITCGPPAGCGGSEMIHFPTESECTEKTLSSSTLSSTLCIGFCVQPHMRADSGSWQDHSGRQQQIAMRCCTLCRTMCEPNAFTSKLGAARALSATTESNKTMTRMKNFALSWHMVYAYSTSSLFSLYTLLPGIPSPQTNSKGKAEP